MSTCVVLITVSGTQGKMINDNKSSVFLNILLNVVLECKLNNINDEH